MLVFGVDQYITLNIFCLFKCPNSSTRTFFTLGKFSAKRCVIRISPAFAVSSPNLAAKFTSSPNISADAPGILSIFPQPNPAHKITRSYSGKFWLYVFDDSCILTTHSSAFIIDLNIISRLSPSDLTTNPS